MYLPQVICLSVRDPQLSTVDNVSKNDSPPKYQSRYCTIELFAMPLIDETVGITFAKTLQSGFLIHKYYRLLSRSPLQAF